MFADGVTVLGTNGGHEWAYHRTAACPGRRPASFGPVPAQIWSSAVLERGYRLYFVLGGRNRMLTSIG